MACMEHECDKCGTLFFNNEVYGYCPKCGESTGRGSFDEEPDNDREDYHDDREDV